MEKAELEVYKGEKKQITVDPEGKFPQTSQDMIWLRPAYPDSSLVVMQEFIRLGDHCKQSTKAFKKKVMVALKKPRKTHLPKKQRCVWA